jgi:hypothetical protein
MLNEKEIGKCYQYFTPEKYEQLFFKSKLSGTFMEIKKTNDFLLNTFGKNLANRFITAQKKTWWMGDVLLGYVLLGTCLLGLVVLLVYVKNIWNVASYWRLTQTIPFSTPIQEISVHKIPQKEQIKFDFLP